MQFVKSVWITLMLAATSVASANPTPYSTGYLAQIFRDNGGAPPAPTPVNEAVNNPVGTQVRSVADVYGGGEALGFADAGVLKAKATATGMAATQDSSGRYFSRAAVSFQDGLSIVAAGLDGQRGFLEVELLYERLLSNAGSAVDGYASAKLTLGTTEWGTGSYIEEFRGGPTTVTVDQIGGNWNGDRLRALIPIVFGDSNTLLVSLDMAALAKYYEGTSTFTADAANSFYWGGIGRVLDANGQTTDAQISAASGINYFQSFVPTSPIPEPSTLLLMAVGFGVLTTLRGRRRHSMATRPC